MRFDIKFIQPLENVGVGTRHSEVCIFGVKEINIETITVVDSDLIIQTEQYLEKLTGLRVHINAIE